MLLNLSTEHFVYSGIINMFKIEILHYAFIQKEFIQPACKALLWNVISYIYHCRRYGVDIYKTISSIIELKCSFYTNSLLEKHYLNISSVNRGPPKDKITKGESEISRAGRRIVLSKLLDCRDRLIGSTSSNDL